jgi:vanillate O-demethylase monooxygenase subunit
MGILDQWHPIYPSRRLGRKPVALKVLDRELVLFRPAAGTVGVLPDCCPHRGMRLSLGRVEKERLVCPYHGWRFDARGNGESPGSPRLHVRSAHLQAAEHRGLIWVKDAGGTGALPPLQHEGYDLLYLAYVPMKAPVESLMENFSEIEHTGTAHWQFGYDGNRMDEVTVETESNDRAVRIRTTGPQMRVWPTSRLAMGMRSGDRLIFDWTTRFSPLHSTADIWWEDPKTNEVRPCRLKETAVFIPVGPNESLAVSFYFWSFQGMRRWTSRLLRPFVSLGVRYELSIDKRLIENVVPQSLYAAGRRLGRFDKGLHELRKLWGRWREEYAMPGREGKDSGVEVS